MNPTIVFIIIALTPVYGILFTLGQEVYFKWAWKHNWQRQSSVW